MNAIHSSVMLLFLVILFSIPVNSVNAAEQPAVKKSKSGICHPVGGSYYGRTKKYTPYGSMKDCLKSGGRRAKR